MWALTVMFAVGFGIAVIQKERWKRLAARWQAIALEATGALREQGEHTKETIARLDNINARLAAVARKSRASRSGAEGAQTNNPSGGRPGEGTPP